MYNIIKNIRLSLFIGKLTSKCHGLSNKTISRHQQHMSNFSPVKLAYSCYESDNTNQYDPIIIMHGLFGNKNNWSSIAKYLNKEMKNPIFTLDARNHGDSPHTADHTYNHLAEDIRLFMDDHSIERCTLIGHSMGGRAVMALALLYPQRVERLVVVDVSPIGSLCRDFISEMGRVFSAIQSVDLSVQQIGLYEFRKSVENQLIEKLKDVKLAQFISMNITADNEGAFRWKPNVSALIHNYTPNITEFPSEFLKQSYCGPSVFIRGANSKFIDLNHSEQIRTLFTAAVFHTVEDAGHWVHADQTQQFLNVLVSFLKNK